MYEVKIDILNSSFVPSPGTEIARILRKLADKIEDTDADTTIYLFDVNGNKVGSAYLSN